MNGSLPDYDRDARMNCKISTKKLREEKRGRNNLLPPIKTDSFALRFCNSDTGSSQDLWSNDASKYFEI